MQITNFPEVKDSLNKPTRILTIKPVFKDTSPDLWIHCRPEVTCLSTIPWSTHPPEHNPFTLIKTSRATQVHRSIWRKGPHLGRHSVTLTIIEYNIYEDCATNQCKLLPVLNRELTWKVRMTVTGHFSDFTTTTLVSFRHEYAFYHAPQWDNWFTTR